MNNRVLLQTSWKRAENLPDFFSFFRLNIPNRLSLDKLGSHYYVRAEFSYGVVEFLVHDKDSFDFERFEALQTLADKRFERMNTFFQSGESQRTYADMRFKGNLRRISV